MQQHTQHIYRNNQTLKIINQNGINMRQYSNVPCAKIQRNCDHCHKIAQRLENVQNQYQKLSHENYAGQLTIYLLKQKNKKLLHKISRSQKQNRQLKQNASHSKNKYLLAKTAYQQLKMGKVQSQKINRNQPLLQTFNPAELRKALSQSNSLQQYISQQQIHKGIQKIYKQNIDYNKQSRDMSNNRISNKQEADCEKSTKKMFNLLDLRLKAQKRLIQLKNQHKCNIDADVVVQKQIQQFRFY